MYRVTQQGSLKDKLLYALGGATTVIHGGWLVDGRGGAPVPNSTVVVEGERITAVGPSADVAIPEGDGVRRIDAKGKTVMPGLIDLHVHLNGDVHSDRYRRYIDPEEGVRIIRGALDAHAVLSAGFTTVRVLGHGTPNQAQSLKQAINTRLIAGPRILHAGWAISQTGGHGNLPIWPYELVEQLRPRSTFADGVNGCRVAVRRILGQGADLVKIYATEGTLSSPPHRQGIPNFTVEEIRAMTDEAHRRGAKVAAHATAAQGVINAVEGGVDTVEHGAPDPQGGWLERIAERGVCLVPTLTVFASAAAKTEGRPQQVAERLQQWLTGSLQAVARAKELGIKIGLGTDDGHGSLAGQNAWELELLTEAGLSPMEALLAGTRNAAEAMGLSEHLGTLEPGRIADLLVVDAHPDHLIARLRQPDNVRLIVKSGAIIA